MKRVPWALAVAVLVAEAAVVLLRPRGGVIDPAEVSAQAYFSPEQLSRAVDFRSPQAALFLAQLGIGIAVLAWVVRRPPRWLARARRPVVAGAAAGAALSVLSTVAALPVGAISRQRAVDVGLVTQSWAGWAGDLVRSAAIGAAIAAAGAAIAVWLVRRLPRTWWLAGAGVVVAFGVAITYAAPVLLDPVFNRFEPLPAGELRTDVLRLADEAGVDVGEVLVMDASRRTTAANAYVAGLGHTKRVVLYDTLVESFTPAETRLVVAHELGHVHHADVPHGLLWLALVAPAGMWAAFVLTRRWAPAGGARVVPALALALAILVPLITTISNQLSRRVEARADSFALELTGAPEPFIGFERRIAVRNVTDPDPAGWRTFLFATHPPTLERIGMGVAYQRGARARAGAPAAERP